MPNLRILIPLALAALGLVLVSGAFDSGDDSPAVRVRTVEPEEGHARHAGEQGGDGGERHPSTPTGAPAGLPPATEDDGGDRSQGLSPRRALGQMIVARFSGPSPSPQFLARIRAGEVGGVILFEEGLAGSEGEIARRIERLQRAALSGGNPPLLVMVDQEGGPVRRLPGPPAVAPRSIDAAAEARAEGEATGGLLRRLGIDVDLAPVVDVGHRGSFLGSRSFSSSPAAVAMLACEFAAGLHRTGVVATLKHFPGLGMATVSTDERSVTIDAAADRIRADYAPYRACGSQPLTLVMVDSAVYPKLTGPLPAVMSPLTYSRELPLAGVSTVTISDALESPPIEAQASPARRAIEAGLDLLLYAKSEATSADAFRRLLEEVQDGVLPVRKVYAAAAKVVALKEQIAAATADR